MLASAAGITLTAIWESAKSHTIPFEYFNVGRLWLHAFKIHNCNEISFLSLAIFLNVVSKCLEIQAYLSMV